MEGESEPSAIERAIRALATLWRRKLTSLDRRNSALYFRELKLGTLSVGDYGDSALKGLIDNSQVLDLSELDHWDDACVRRLTAIRSKARENEEERGIQTLFLGIGMASWKATDGGRDPCAPLLLLPVKVVDRAHKPRLERNGDLIPNQVMLQSWSQEHDLDVPELANEDAIDAPVEQACARLELYGRELDGFSVSEECHLSNFSFAKMAMVQDLGQNFELLLGHRLIRAIAGDKEAQDDVRELGGTVPRDELDAIDPEDELIVLEADEYQRQAIHSLTRFESDGVIHGPPGTGKSQTIANLIAALVGKGKRVLFVAEKRAALDAVKNRLAQAGLDDLVLDLHGGDATRKTVYDRLRARNERARIDSSPELDGQKLRSLRDKLNAYRKALHTPSPATGLSPRQIIERLVALQRRVDAQTVFMGQECENLDVERYLKAKEALESLINAPSLFLRDETAPWSRSNLGDADEVAEAMRLVTELRTNVEAVCKHLGSAERTAKAKIRSIDDLKRLVDALVNLAVATERYSEDILSIGVDALANALKPAMLPPVIAWLVWAFNSDYRKGLRTAKALASARSSAADLAKGAIALSNVPAELRTQALFAMTTPTYAERAKELWSAIATAKERIAQLSEQTLASRIVDFVQDLREMETAGRDARRIPEVRGAEATIIGLGFGAFIDEIRESTPHDPSEWSALLEQSWLQSHLERIKNLEPAIGRFARATHERTLAEFRRIDEAHVTATRAIVRQEASQAYIQSLNAERGQQIKFAAELQKKARNMPIRRLVRETGAIVTSLCPCWMASPLSVSQLIPAQQLFDVVIFDEASQVLPEDAMAAIMRGQRAIVAGDQKQLPPTLFFASGTLDPEDDEEASDPDPELLQISTEGLESLLDLMITFAGSNGQYLDVHYRSLDEALIRFSNHEFYNDRLITLPGTGGESFGVSHELVNAPRCDGEELSSTAEIGRVVELILEHAEQHPHETLGVIALGLKHARRIEAALDRERRNRDDLDEFFAKDDVNRAFFVKNLERVQGDERDTIILSMGYAKDASGRLKNKLGPLNFAGGERRLNVAVTRAKTRMKVVSTFTSEDMDLARFTSEGARRLSRYLEYARSGGKTLSDVQTSTVEVNDFERDVMEALMAKGMRIIPQLGVSQYRLDLAVQHPEMPGRFVLAIECDGARYHSSATARDRDRLRQRHLESLGWRVHRIWSLDWLHERDAEIERAMRAYEQVLRHPSGSGVDELSAAGSNVLESFFEGNHRRKRGPQPRVFSYGRPITDWSDREIGSIFDWIVSDGVLRADEEIIEEAIPAMGFARRGKNIDQRLHRVMRAWRKV